jgi:glycosyltransferase involved in cell wall biosynthesis
MIKVGLVLSLRGLWQGGVNYYHNLLSCYQRYPDDALRLEVFTDYDEDILCYQSDAIGINLCSEVSLRGLWNIPRRAMNRLLHYDPMLLRLVRHHQIDLLTHRSLGRQRTVNTLPWLPDFQHKKFPEFFTANECENRNASVANAGLWGNILLSSHAAARDFRCYYPHLSSVQTRVLHFSNTAALSIVPLSREELKAQYPVDEPYFFLPNQFWRHKNHAVVVEALRQAPANIRVICTGNMKDTRDLSYGPNLLAKVREAGVEERFLCLGAVPYPILVSLMHHSVAVLQPSLFEGWSTSVEESKAMGKRIVLSNIDVHLEQAPERGVFFSPDSPEQLAACMVRIIAECEPATEKSYANQRPLYAARNEREWIGEFARILRAASTA